jgi:PadR family transcriptional regulator, regulatory protein PadR
MMAVNKELMKGSTGTLILTLLSRKQMYGYEIIKELELLSSGLFEMREGTLYPILHALEEAGHITSNWVGEEGSRQRKYYVATKSGKALLKEKRDEWISFKMAVDKVVLG